MSQTIATYQPGQTKTLYENQTFKGERALFKSVDLSLEGCTFCEGESPLKESHHLTLKRSTFQWKYPLWYCHDIALEDSSFFEMARSGIWYTHRISLKNSLVAAPKIFRRSSYIELENVDMPNATETLWHCENISLKNVMARGDYFGMNCSNVEIEALTLVGNYAFDGAKNVTMRHSKLLSKDAFWNCETITVYDSFISGEYFGWNSKNVTLVNCTIESLQGLCYMENLVMKNCRLLNTTLAFEYSTVDAEIISSIESIKNPYAGNITAKHIDELIFDDQSIQKERIVIHTTQE